jgi:hypothetical protein
MIYVADNNALKKIKQHVPKSINVVTVVLDLLTKNNACLA